MYRIPHHITTLELAAKKGYIPQPSCETFGRTKGPVRVYTTDASALNACERYGRPVAICRNYAGQIMVRWAKGEPKASESQSTTIDA